MRERLQRASLQGEEAAGLPYLTMLVYGHEHDGFNTGGHDISNNSNQHSGAGETPNRES